MTDNVRIEFATIDARDDVYTRYSVVGFVNDVSNRPAYLTPHNGAVALRMEREYLTRLYTLQQEIAEKYLSLWVDDESYLPEDETYGHGMTREQYEVADTAARAAFPGKEAAYYT